MKELKNGFLDIFLFVIYHSIAIAVSIVLILSLSYNINVFDLDSLKKAALNDKTRPVEAAVIVRSLPKIMKTRGTILISDSNSLPRLAKLGEELKQGSSIETKEKSFVLLSFGDKYSCYVRIGSNSKLNIDELLLNSQNNNSEQSFVSLIKGTLSVAVKKMNETPVIKIKTAFAIFGVRGTQFSVLTDAINYSLLVVKEGKVEAENVIAFRKRIVSTGASYLVNKNGEEKEFSDTEMINKFEWDLENLTIDHPEMEEMITMLGNPDLSPKKEDFVINSTPDKTKSLKELVQIEIDIFKRYDVDLQDYLSNDIQFLNELLLISEKERLKIKNDIFCLSTTRSQCDLYSEKLLMSRGFPRTFGTPRFIQMMIEDLNKYMKEQDDQISVAKSDKASLEDLISKRKILLENVEKQFLAGTELETIIPRLKDDKMRRKKP